MREAVFREGLRAAAARWRTLGRLVLALGAALSVGSCRSRDGGQASEQVTTRRSAVTASASQILSSLQATPGSPLQAGIAQGFSTLGGALQAQIPAGALASELKPASVSFPGTASGALHLQDVASGMAVDVTVAGALAATAQTTGGYVVYPSAVAGGGHLLHRPMANGSEDFVGFPTRPAVPEVDYTVAIGTGVAGLRLVGGALEFVDGNGAPRLHVAPPFIVGSNGTLTDGALAVANCAVDTDPSPPWGRPVTPPGATTCTIRLTWPDASVSYPAILDPRWTTTGSMITARYEHTLTLLASNGKVLAAGGRSSTGSTTGLATAELYDRSTGVWASTGSFSGGRRLHTATQLLTSGNPTTSGKVLIAGGISGSTSLNTAQLYSPSAGTWIAAGNLNSARHLQTENLLPDGRVLVSGGMSGSSTLQTAATYNPASGSGTWAATTGPIPPPGWKLGTATLIQTTNSQLNNHVLLVGGNNGTSTISSVYLYDPVQNAFSTLASLSSPREQHAASILPNANGKILVSGGKNGATVLATALIFDPSVSNGTWSSAGTMTSARFGHSATVLPQSIVANGSLLVAGGSSTGSNTLSSAELFSGTSTWTATPSLPGPLQGHGAVLLSNNMVLVAGGLSSASTVSSAAYLYDSAFGLSCGSASQCPTGFCVNGVCCDTACNGGCGACNLAGHLGTCTALSNGTVCRAAAGGGCDVAETCNGSSLSCPADGFASASTTCRAAGGECDLEETCTGSSAACPADAKKASGTACADEGNACTTDLCNGSSVFCQHAAGNAGAICRAAGGECDLAETCTGSSSTCPVDAKKPNGIACTDDGNVCTTDTCNGSSAACQHPAGNAGTVCRAVAGECDVAEACTGSSSTCPTDAKKPNGTACTDDGNVCTTDSCNGSSAVCQHPAGNAGVVCRAITGPCDVQETCTGASAVCPADVFKAASTTCRVSAGECDVAETCTGSAASCPADGFASPDTICRPSTGANDLAEACTGASASCPADGSVQEPTPQPEPGVGPEFNGTLTGQLGVSPTGAATFTVPIAIPPGIAGVAPNLSLVYNSQGGNGLAGQGWELAGLSMIHRCPKTRVQDGQGQLVTMGNLLDGDGICLDGKRLFESPTTPGEFETEIEDFSKITRVDDSPFPDTSISPSSGSVSFKVVTKSGETRYYGARDTHDARVLLTDEFRGYPDPALGREISIWLLDRVVDVWGNYFDVHYNDDQADFPTRGILVTKIDYTGHIFGHGFDEAGNPTADEQQAPFHSITFSYEDRPDVRHIRFHSQTLPKKKRLTAITTPLGTYSLDYESADVTLPTRLKRINYCTVHLPLPPPPALPAHSCLEPLEFDWDAGGYRWEEVASSVAPPIGIDGFFVAENEVGSSNGTQFVDLDGDGRVDLVASKEGGSVYQAWRNTGQGWDPRPAWQVPANLFKSNGRQAGTFFADIDGDGMPDLIGSPFSAGTGCSPAAGKQLCVWLNRIKQNPSCSTQATCWVRDDARASLPPNWGSVNLEPSAHKEVLADFDGDGKVDMARAGPGDYQFDVLLSTPTGWVLSPGHYGTAVLGGFSSAFHVEDINRDGLADLVSNNNPSFPATFLAVGLNQGSHQGNGSDWKYTQMGADPNATADLGRHRSGDVDGDGLYDSVWSLDNGDRGVALATGTGYTSSELATGYASAVQPLAGGFYLADVNADGLVDYVQSRSPGLGPLGPYGAVSINTGTTWIDPGWFDNGPADHVVPVSPAYPYDGAEFIDLDGDGVNDLVQSVNDFGGAPIRRAWMNRFHPPIITKFPDGLARKTDVAYSVITTADATAQGTYVDDLPLVSRTTHMMLPLRVVASVSKDNGLGSGGSAVTTYKYHSFRGSSDGRGPQGFGRVDIIDPSGIITSSDHAQVFPYTGMPTAVYRYISLGGRPPDGPDAPLTETHTTYCNTIQEDANGNPLCTSDAPVPGTAVSVYPVRVTDRSFFPVGAITDLTTSGEFLQTTSDFRYDALGNSIRTTVTIQGPGETYEKKTVNFYGTPGSDEQKLGKLTRAVVTSQRVAPVGPAIVNTTDFEYGTVNVFFGPPIGQPHNTLGLKRKKLEPGCAPATSTEVCAVEAPFELHSVYHYDQFGNVAAATDCASDFGNCAIGQPGPADLPFRTSRVSYDPADFNSPTGPGLLSTLGFTQKGRFPVKTTNALGHAEYSAYDPIKGVRLQMTGPNGIHSCYGYTDLGRPISVTERCGSAGPMTTTTNQYRTTVVDPVLAAIVTVTRPPTGATTFLYTDVLGRKIDVRGRSFDGAFTQARTTYDSLGRVLSQTAPRLPGASEYATSFQYDEFGRVKRADQELGDITGTGATASTSTRTIYLGLTTRTERTRTNDQLQQEVQAREERKNTLGKITAVTDALCASLADSSCARTSYAYDADGNLTDTTDPAGNVVHLHYDQRGRKDLTIDPDLGMWVHAYDGFGDLVAQIDNKAQTTTMTYDVLARMRTKTDASGTAEWVYDVAPGAGVGKLAAMVSAPDARLAGPCTIPNTTVTGGSRSGRSFTYTQFGDIENEDQCVDAETFRTTRQYDGIGRLGLVLYPDVNGSRLSIGYRYTNLGFLHYLTDAATNSLYWRATAMNALGQVTGEIARNGVETLGDHNPVTGWLRSSFSVAHADGDALVQSRNYRYDEMGNLTDRYRLEAAEITLETFTYDPLNRLKTSTVRIASPPYIAPESFDYDALGNITQKSGKTYGYGTCGAGPHAVCTVGESAPFVYDPNGNMVSGNDRTVTYNARNKATRIQSAPAVSQGNDTGVAEFIYGADDNRVVQTVSGPTGSTARTLYVGLGDTGKSFYERTTRGSTIEHAQFIYAGGSHGGSAFAIRVVTNDGAQAPTSAAKYYHFDHLGSVIAMSDERGHVDTSSGANAAVFAYDAWGARRNPDSTPANPASFNQQVGRREFTGHETIPNVGLVNMNGRVYDPVIGRFLTPDPHVQFVSDLQSFNRYSYVLNNPLRNTDPTGYFLGLSWSDFTSPSFLLTVVAIGACTAGPLGCTVGGLFLTAYNTTAMAVSGASFGQIVAVNGIGLFAGGIGGSVVSAAGGGPLAQMLGGAISGGISAGITNEAFQGGRDLGSNILKGALFGAAGAGLTLAAKSVAPVTQATATEALGEGGSGERRLEEGEKSEEARGYLGRRGGRDADDQVWCGGSSSVKCGGPADPKLDALARKALEKTYGVGDEFKKVDMPLHQASLTSGHEYGVVILREPDGSIRLSEVFEGNYDSVPYKWRSNETPLAFVHTHPESPGAWLGWISVGDTQNSIQHGIPNYVLSTLTGEVQVYYPATPRSSAYIRALPTD